ncbi:hypothetical protein [Escherichia phage dw-ec]|nr:hypothetical protein [Escherichia phage dw-ec]
MRGMQTTIQTFLFNASIICIFNAIFHPLNAKRIQMTHFVLNFKEVICICFVKWINSTKISFLKLLTHFI